MIEYGDPMPRVMYFDSNGRQMPILNVGEISEILRTNRLHGPGCPALPEWGWPARCNCWLSTDVGVWRDAQTDQG